MPNRLFRLALLPAWLALGAACSAPTPEALLSDARTAIAAGELRTAEIHLKNFLQREPDNVTARVLLGDVALASGDVLAAEQNLRRALALGADASAVHLSLTRALLAQRKYEDTVAQLEAGPELAGEARVEAMALKGAALRGLGRREQSEAAYRAALGLAPTSPQVRSELAALLLEGRRINEGRALVEKVLADQPDYVPALLLRADLESVTGQPAAAEATLQSIVELERNGVAPTAGYATALARLAEVQLDLGKVVSADANVDALLALTPRNPRAQFIKAAIEVRQDDLDGAERRLEGLIVEADDYWPAYRLLGVINVRQGQLGQATMYLRTAVNNDASDAAARLALAEVYVREGNIDAAKQLIETSQSAGLSDGMFFAFVGQASLQAGMDEQAARYFDQSETALPEDAEQLIGLSRIYVAAGEFDRAVRMLQSTVLDDAQGRLLRDYLLALLQVRQGDLDAADATAQRVAAAQPNVAWPLALRGTVAMLAGRLSAAQEWLAKALDIEPNNTGTLLNAARVAAASSDVAGAQGFLDRVLEIDENNTAAIIGAAQLAARRRDFPAAQAWAERLPQSPVRRQLEAELLAAQGRFDAAAAAMARAFDAHPAVDLAVRAYDLSRRAGLPNPDAKLRAWNTDNPRDPTSNFVLGSFELENGQHDAAVARYEAVLAVNPLHAPTLNNLAWIFSQQGDARALDYAERAHTADPNNPAIADTLGWLHVQRGDATKGLPLLTTAARQLGEQAEVQYHWGVALAETGDTAEALEVFDAALALSDGFEGRDDAERRAAALRNRNSP
jgi:cellulose synthase operon protein C